MAQWTDSSDAQESYVDDETPLLLSAVQAEAIGSAPPVAELAEVALSPTPEAPSRLVGPCGWPVPSSLCPNADQARALIALPEFDPLLLEKARVISSRFPF